MIWKKNKDKTKKLKTITDDMTPREKEQVLEYKKRVIRRWAIVAGLLALATFGFLFMTLLDHVLKGAPDGGLEINYSKLDSKLAWLGSEIQELDATISDALNLTANTGVLVNGVVPGSPADVGGLQRGDVIVSMNGVNIVDSFQIQDLISDLEPGDTVRLLVDTIDGGTQNVYVTLGAKPDDTPPADTGIQKTAGTTDMAVNPVLSTPWGISVSPLTDEVREQFNIPTTEQGVVIVAVVQGSLADSQGLEVGDVIESINQVPTANLQALYQALKDDENVLMDVYSPDDAKRFFVTLPDEGDSPPQVVLMSFGEEITNTNRIIVPSDSANLNGQVYYRFASAPYFILYDYNTNQATAIANPYAAQVRGMGITVAQMLIDFKIDAVIVGGIGPQSFDTFYLAKIKVYGPATGFVRTAMTNYQLERLPELKEANLGGYGNSSAATIQTGGSPWTEEEDEEESGGLDGQPLQIPPMGKPIELTAQGDARASRPETCLCPNCGAEVTHPASTSCADMVCPICGSQLMTASPGTDSITGTDITSQLPATDIPTTLRPIALTAGSTVAPTSPPSRVAAIPTSATLWAISNQPATTPPVSVPTQQTAGSAGGQVSVCVCPVDGTTVTHPVGIPCAALQCPLCGSRMVSDTSAAAGAITQTAGMLTAGVPTAGMPTAGMQTGGKPDDVPPVQQAFYLVPISSTPAPMGQIQQSTNQLQQVALVPIVGGPPADTGSAPTDTGSAPIDVGGSSQSARSTLCECPMCHTMVAHPIGVPCSQLSCPVCGSRLVNAAPGGDTAGGAIQTGGKPDDVPPVQQTFYLVPVAGGPPADTGSAPTDTGSAPTDVGGSSQSARSTLCECPMCHTTVAHPIGIPCSQLSCPVCGSRLVNAAPGGDTAGGAMQTGNATQTGGQPDGVPPVQQAFYLVPISSQPDGVPLLGQSTQSVTQLQQVALVQIAGGPPADMGMGGATDSGTAVDGPAQGGGQASTGGAAQSGRSDLCVCPMCAVTVTHPISVPCSSLNCPVCGSRLVNQTPGGASGDMAVQQIALTPTAGTMVATTSSIIPVSAGSRKLVIPSDGRSLKSNVATLLDEARYFMMFGLGTYDVVPNPYYRDKRATGAEIAQFIVSEGGAIVICNNISASALKSLQSLKVKVYDGIVGTVQQALDIYSDGRLGSSSTAITLDDDEEHGGGGPPASKSSKTKEKDSDAEIF